MIFPTLHLKFERWKFNKDYGIYVSTLGNFKDRHKRRLPIKINQNGYCLIETEKGLKLAHRLVMLTWKPIPDAENLTVDHLNHNKRDNSVANLEWVTAQENKIRAVRDYITTNEPIPNVAFEVNGQICYNNFAVWAIVSEHFDNPKFPKETVYKALEALRMGINPTGAKKIGKKNPIEIKLVKI